MSLWSISQANKQKKCDQVEIGQIMIENDEISVSDKEFVCESS